MKKILPIILFSLTILVNFGYGKSVKESEITQRDGKVYLVNSNKPYSGKVVSYHENGQLKK